MSSLDNVQSPRHNQTGYDVSLRNILTIFVANPVYPPIGARTLSGSPGFEEQAICLWGEAGRPYLLVASANTSKFQWKKFILRVMVPTRCGQ